MLYFINPNRDLPDSDTKDAPQVMLELYDQLEKCGDFRESRTGTVKELYGVRFTLFDNDLDHLREYFSAPTARPATPFGRVHGLTSQTFNEMVMTGQAIPAFQSPGSKAYADVVAKLPALQDQLLTNEGTRQALVFIGTETCFTSVQFMIRDGRLQMLLNARSINLTKGLVYDALFWNEKLFAPLARVLKIPRGGMHFSVGSLHLETHHRNIQTWHPGEPGCTLP